VIDFVLYSETKLERSRFVSVVAASVEAVLDSGDEYVTLMMASGSIIEVVGDYKNIKSKIEVARER
jgi:hypothetical protein